MKLKLIVLVTATIVCIATIAKSAVVHGAQSSSSKEKPVADNGEWWLAAFIAKRISNPTVAGKTTEKKQFFRSQRQVGLYSLRVYILAPQPSSGAEDVCFAAVTSFIYFF